MKKTKIMKKLIIETLSNSTAHAIPNIVRSKEKGIKLMWFIFLIISTGLCSFLIIQGISDYFDREVNSKTRTYFRGVEILFPKIRICQKNMFTTEYAYKFLKEIIKEKNLTDLFNSTEMNNFDLFKINEMIIILNYIANGVIKNSTHVEKEKFGFSIKDILIFCMFNNHQCNYTDFNQVFDNRYGNCFEFNSGKNFYGNQLDLKRSIKEGSNYGLSLTIFSAAFKEIRSITWDLGIKIYINDNSHSLADKIETTQIYLANGFEHYIGIEKMFRTQMPKPFSDCDGDYLVQNSEFYNTLIKGKGIYKRYDCLNLCYQKYITITCNCSDYWVSENLGFDTCISQHEIECINNFYLNNYSKNEFIIKNCYPICPLECKKNEYKLKTMSTNLSPEIYYNNLKNKNNQSIFQNETLTIDFFRQNSIKINIYYDTLADTIITESESINIISLLSNLGGTLGLFLGISVLSFAEFFEIMVKYILIKTMKNHVIQIN